MAWTTPLDWTGISDDIVTAAQLNQQVRDNLNVLSTHAHTGAAGMGVSTLSGVSLTAIGTLTFADQSANPDAAGEIQRNGNDVLWYGSSVVNLSQADAVAATASLRTLGTGATEAAAGNHTHVPSSEATGVDEDDYQVLDTDTETTLSTATATPGATNRAWVCYGVLGFATGDGGTYTARLKFDATTLTTRTGLTGVQPMIVGFQANPSVGSHSVTITVERTVDGGAFGVTSAVGFTEVEG